MWSRHHFAPLLVEFLRSILLENHEKAHWERPNWSYWVTNVGNEYGSILSSVVTISESSDDLELMATSIGERYKTANVTEPIILYTDRDCCSASGNSKYHQLFKAWKILRVCLDIWHFIWRFSEGYTSDSHPLHGVFFKELSRCIFEWDREDFSRLMDAKRGELKSAGIVSPTIEAIKRIKKGEMTRHCSDTRGVHKKRKD